MKTRKKDVMPLIVGISLLIGAIILSFIAIIPKEIQLCISGSLKGKIVTIPLKNATKFEDTHRVYGRVLNVSTTVPAWLSFNSVKEVEIIPGEQKIVNVEQPPTLIAIHLASHGTIDYMYSLNSYSTSWSWLGVPAAICSVVGFGLSIWGSAIFIASRTKSKK
jgi:hypothetical protein